MAEVVVVVASTVVVVGAFVVAVGNVVRVVTIFGNAVDVGGGPCDKPEDMLSGFLLHLLAISICSFERIFALGIRCDF